MSEPERTLDDYTQGLRRFLDDRPREGWVFGACAAIAHRSGWDLWVVRLIAAILLLSLTLATALAYFCIAMLLPETRPRAQRRLSAWARRADDVLEAVVRGLRNMMRSARSRENRSDRYPPEMPHNGIG